MLAACGCLMCVEGALLLVTHGANKGWGFAETTPNDFWEDARHWRTLFHTWILNFHFNNNCDADELYSDWLAEVTYDSLSLTDW